MSALRVLHLFPYFRPDFTGDGVYWERLQPLLNDMAVCAEVLAIRSAPPTPASDNARNPKGAFQAVHYLGTGQRRGLAEDIALFRSLGPLIDRVDLLHLHGACGRGFAAQLRATLARIPVLQSCTLDDSPAEIVASYSPLFRPAARRMMRLVDAFVAISPALADSPPELTKRVHIIPQGISVPPLAERDRSLRQRLGFADSDVVVLFLGGITPRKGVIDLVEAVAAARDRLPELALWLVGPVLDDAYANAVQQRIGALCLSDRVRMEGYTDRPGDHYANADLFVLPSYREGFGNVALEAMAAGLPVIARRLPGVTDSFIAPEQNGVLFDDSAGLTGAIARLAGDAALRQRLGEAARQDVADRFDLPSLATQYRDLYRDLASGRTG